MFLRRSPTFAWARTLVTGAVPEHFLRFLLLLLSSVCLYWAGMVFNDYFDIEQDKRERPFRPLASGRVALSVALRIGLLLLALGVGFAALADLDSGGLRWRSLPLAAALVIAILLYDSWFKRTWAGPACSWGSCRFFNILLGLSVSAEGAGRGGVATERCLWSAFILSA